ncbi:galactose oxidase early set domain-containing protein [Acidobacteria bacterium AH-259-G07]|nr:galactose oxidase early set domain-containing protein [Acidobacteria bacterium AH-259-G07]
MNPHELPRLYHTTALLLRDGRVLLAGGNNHRGDVIETASFLRQQGRLGGSRERPRFEGISNTDFVAFDQNTDFFFEGREPEGAGRGLPAEIHYVEIFEPPYLHTGKPQPMITNIPDGTDGNIREIRYGQVFDIELGNVESKPEQGKVTMVKLGSVTHGADMGQRLVRLDIDGSQGNSLRVIAPRNGNLAPPGVYMLFYVSRDGVPSTGEMVQLSCDRSDGRITCGS